MIVSYARTPLAKSIFLAGPTPRDSVTKSWRPEAITLLEKHGFDGMVFVPEDSDASWKFSYDDQVEWELEALHSATCVLFWVPRELKHMPALTTNCEYALFAKNRNVVLGYPDTAEKMKYLHSLSYLYNINVHGTLEATVVAAMKLTQRPFPTSC